jgi:ribosomal protein L3
LLVRGSVPGPSGTYIFIRRAKNAKKVSAPAAAPKRAK